MVKTLQELTISDNLMFGAVMTMLDNCRRMLELSLDISVGSVEVNTEKRFFYHPEYKGVRLDVYAKDENNTHYDVEMKVAKKEALGDERYTVFLSTEGENADEVPKELITFLDYVKANLSESTQDFNDNYVRQLQESVKQVKKSREMGVRYMQLQELLKEERAEGRREELAKNILFTLRKRGMNPDESLRESIVSENDLKFLNNLMDAAFEVKSLEEFVEKMN